MGCYHLQAVVGLEREFKSMVQTKWTFRHPLDLEAFGPYEIPAHYTLPETNCKSLWKSKNWKMPFPSGTLSTFSFGEGTFGKTLELSRKDPSGNNVDLTKSCQLSAFKIAGFCYKKSYPAFPHICTFFWNLTWHNLSEMMIFRILHWKCQVLMSYLEDLFWGKWQTNRS